MMQFCQRRSRQHLPSCESLSGAVWHAYLEVVWHTCTAYSLTQAAARAGHCPVYSERPAPHVHWACAMGACAGVACQETSRALECCDACHKHSLVMLWPFNSNWSLLAFWRIPGGDWQPCVRLSAALHLHEGHSLMQHRSGLQARPCAGAGTQQHPSFLCRAGRPLVPHPAPAAPVPRHDGQTTRGCW